MYLLYYNFNIIIISILYNYIKELNKIKKKKKTKKLLN